MEGQLKVCLVGGPPWGFRLGGGREFNIPLAVAKLRKQSVAWRAGLCENDEVLAINGVPCGTLTHTQAMQLVDYGGDYLEFLIKRTTDVEGLLHEQAVPHLSSTQKTNDYSINTGGKVMITQARQYPSQDPSSTWPGKVETSHCTDGVGVTSVSVQLTKPANDGTPPKVEYGPEGVSLQLNVPCNEISADLPESTPMAAEPPIQPFLSGGIPAEMNMDEEELIATYRERAKQAKLHRSESLAEKQQREMRRRCETIASSLASPGSSAAEYGAESKGAALFRKRRRRVKHYTLISYGTASEGVPGEEGVEYEEGDEDDDREEEGEEVNWGSQEDLFTGCNEWDHLEKGSVEQETNSAIDPGLGKGAKMFERRRQRLEELGKETSQHWVSEGKNVEDKSVVAVQNHPQLNGGTTYTSPMNAMPFGRASGSYKTTQTKCLQLFGGCQGFPEFRATKSNAKAWIRVLSRGRLLELGS
uniref:PDZ domain-containing protein n=1 Tax=Eptatretus burgeri TaxID=7764 RepID=A0A8C4Q497_EPTBU